MNESREKIWYPKLFLSLSNVKTIFQSKWYRPKSLSNIDDEEQRSSIWSGSSSDIDDTSSETHYGRRNLNPVATNFATQVRLQFCIVC